jgi:hypothetical protein
MSKIFRISGEVDNVYIQAGASNVTGTTAPIVFTGMGGVPEHARITADGKFSIGGVVTPLGPLHVAYCPLVLDQSQIVSTSSWSHDDHWQTFTAGTSGVLGRVSINLGAAYAGNIEIYGGSGMSGSLLSQTAVTIGSSGVASIDIAPCSVMASQMYTLAIRGTATWAGTTSDVYAGGSSRWDGGDKYFQTWVRGAPIDVFIVKTTGAYLNGVLEQNGLTQQTILVDIADSAEIVIPSNTVGWGFIQAGDNLAYAKFSWNTAHIVILRYNSANVVTTNTTGNVCVYDNGDNVAIRNRLGDTLTFQGELHYAVVNL